MAYPHKSHSNHFLVIIPLFLGPMGLRHPHALEYLSGDLLSPSHAWDQPGWALPSRLSSDQALHEPWYQFLPFMTFFNPRMPEELWNSCLWGHPKARPGLYAKRASWWADHSCWPAWYCFCRITWDRVTKKVLTCMFGVTQKMNLGLWATKGLPPTLGFELCVWVPVLTLSCQCSHCGAACGPQHQRTTVVASICYSVHHHIPPPPSPTPLLVTLSFAKTLGHMTGSYLE